MSALFYFQSLEKKVVFESYFRLGQKIKVLQMYFDMQRRLNIKSHGFSVQSKNERMELFWLNLCTPTLQIEIKLTFSEEKNQCLMFELIF